MEELKWAVMDTGTNVKTNVKKTLKILLIAPNEFKICLTSPLYREYIVYIRLDETNERRLRRAGQLNWGLTAAGARPI